MDLSQKRVRIVDIAEALGLSTATVSNMIHGKTSKISDETVKRVHKELERTGYIPNMAGILLARNNSRIIGVVINDHIKYEGRVLEDGFVMSSLNALSHEVNKKGYFLMINTTADIREIPVFASMWNMDGLILMGFCEADYEKLRNQMRISFVVYDGYFEKCSKVVNLVIDHFDGGFQAGEYLKQLGHKKALRFQMIGFDDSAASRESRPALTTIRQDPVLRAKSAIECIEAMRDGRNCEEKILLPVELIKRESTRELSCQNL